MSDRGTSRAELQSAVEAAGNVLAQAFGLGDETRISTDWPIDDGDSVLVGQLAGDSTGTMVLAVNEEVAERLLNDPNVLNTGFANAGPRRRQQLSASSSRSAPSAPATARRPP